jgi:hypothetical protein
MKQISLTQDKFALVDDQDYGFLMQWKWYALMPNKVFYAVRCVWKNSKTILMHQIIAKRMGLKGNIDHKDTDGLNNQRINLRVATKSQNGANHGINKTNTTGYKGVWKVRQRFRAGIMLNQKSIHLGYYSTLEEAAKAYNKAALEYFGKFARLNDVS